MLYRTLHRMVARGMTDELRNKIEALHELGRLTDDEYAELVKGDGVTDADG